MIYAKSFPTTFISDYRASNDMNQEISFDFPKTHTIMIVNPLASAAEIERHSKQYGVKGQPIRLPIWRTPDMPIGECSIRCAIQDDIANEYSGLYED